MGQFFADVHASAASQLGNAPCDLADAPEVTALRSARSMTNCCSWDRHYVINCVITMP